MKPNEDNALSYTSLASLWWKGDKMRSVMNLDVSSNSGGEGWVVGVSAAAEPRVYKANI